MLPCWAHLLGYFKPGVKRNANGVNKIIPQLLRYGQIHQNHVIYFDLSCEQILCSERRLHINYFYIINKSIKGLDQMNGRWVFLTPTSQGRTLQVNPD